MVLDTGSRAAAKTHRVSSGTVGAGAADTNHVTVRQSAVFDLAFGELLVVP